MFPAFFQFFLALCRISSSVKCFLFCDIWMGEVTLLFAGLLILLTEVFFSPAFLKRFAAIAMLPTFFHLFLAFRDWSGEFKTGWGGEGDLYFREVPMIGFVLLFLGGPKTTSSSFEFGLEPT